MDKVADLLESGIGEFPAVGDYVSGSREQGKHELVARFSLLKNKSHCSIISPEEGLTLSVGEKQLRRRKK